MAASTFTLKKTYASLPATTRGKALVINGDPKGKNFLYCNGNYVFIRDFSDSSVCDVYAEHSKETTMAAYSPSGFYIASGDILGKVRIWDTTNVEHILKYEHQPISGAIRDLAWDMDSKRIVAVGEGRETYGKAFLWDSGSSCGTISGHTASINSVAMKQSRPIRLATASEDRSAIFSEGIPFKSKHTMYDHNNFVNTVRYAPDGSKFVTGSMDGLLFVYDGKVGTKIGTIPQEGGKAHQGGIYAICFNSDGSKLLSVSGDKTAKIWDLDDNSLETDFMMGDKLDDMQVGCLWQGNNILTVSLSGFINYLDQHDTTKPRKIVKGHNKAITALAVSADSSELYTASFDGRICQWDAKTSECEDFKGKGHTNQIRDLVVDGDNLISIAMDDTIRFTNAASRNYSQECAKFESQPVAMDSLNGITVVACIEEVAVFGGLGKKLSYHNLKTSGKSVSIHPGGTQVAVGTETHLIIYDLDNNVLSEQRSFPHTDVLSVHYSPDGASLAASSKSSVRMYDTQEWKEQIAGWGDVHTASVRTLRWSPDSRRFASGGVDSHLVLWEVGKFVGKKPSVKAHPLSSVNKLRWLDNNTIVTVGQDCNIKIWTVSN